MSPEGPAGGIVLENRELIGVYLLLKEKESALDRIMLRLLNRIERKLYEQLTIEEFRNIEALYKI